MNLQRMAYHQYFYEAFYFSLFLQSISNYENDSVKLALQQNTDMPDNFGFGLRKTTKNYLFAKTKHYIRGLK